MDVRVIDANLNRVSEGLRVIEEFVRFVRSNPLLCTKITRIRHVLNGLPQNYLAQLQGRHVAQDARAYEIPAARKDMLALLRANFKRVTEGLRVLEEYTGSPTYSQLRYDVYILEKEIILYAMKPAIRHGVYVISDTVETLLDAATKGAVLIQLRDKHASKEIIYNKALALKSQQTTDVPFIINDYLDIALAVDADGLHTGQEDLPIPIQRQVLGDHKLIGRSTHTYEQGCAAAEAGADYVSVGPVWETPSKPGRDAIGFAYLEQANSLPIPYVAIGGISLDTVADIQPYDPPMVGIIRAVEHLTEIQQKMGWL